MRHSLISLIGLKCLEPLERVPLRERMERL